MNFKFFISLNCINTKNMKGGTRSNRRINPDSVHSLLPNNANSIRNGLEKMTPDERFKLYIEVHTDEPENIQLFEDIFREEYPHEFAAAYATPSWETATKADFGRSIHDLLMDGPKGGKTRRNRRGRGRGRGRRSLKHKHSKRR
jgi:hypothetical protein